MKRLIIALFATLFAVTGLAAPAQADVVSPTGTACHGRWLYKLDFTGLPYGYYTVSMPVKPYQTPEGQWVQRETVLTNYSHWDPSPFQWIQGQPLESTVDYNINTPEKDDPYIYVSGQGTSFSEHFTVSSTPCNLMAAYSHSLYPTIVPSQASWIYYTVKADGRGDGSAEYTIAPVYMRYTVTNPAGQVVYRQNHLVRYEHSAVVIWDGRNMKGQDVRPGKYTVRTTFYNAYGYNKVMLPRFIYVK